MRPQCRTNREAGFTLTELLVASVLISVVMASVYTMFWSVIGPWRAVEQDYDTYRDSRNILTLIEREMNNFVPNAAHLFEGSDDEVTLYAVSEPMDVEKAEGRHLMQVQYRFKKAAGEIVREEAQVISPLPTLPPAGKELDRQRIRLKNKEEFLVASHVEDFSIRYVWLPLPELRKPEIPPTPILPVHARRHKERWGLPQGIEITLKLQDPDTKGAFHTIVKTIPFRAPNAFLTRKQLDERIGSYL